jgi:PAS domain S-box-containing protein
MANTARDEFRQITFSLQENTQYFRSIFEDSAIGMALLSPAGRFQCANKAFCKFTGYQENELLAQNFSLVLPIVDTGSEIHRWERQLPATTGHHQYEQCYRHKLEHNVWGLVSASVLYQDDGRLCGLLLQVQDITEQKRSEEAVLVSQHMLLTLINNLPGMAFRAQNDRSRTLEFVSAGCLAVTGYRAEELLKGKIVFTGLIHPDDRRRFWEQLQNALEQRLPYRLSYRLISADKTPKQVEEQGCGIYSDNGEVIALEGLLMTVSAC